MCPGTTRRTNGGLLLEHSPRPQSSNIVLAFSAPDEDSINPALIETLLYLLQMARAGKISSAAFVAFSHEAGFSLTTHQGVEDHEIPFTMGLLDCLKLQMAEDWNESNTAGEEDEFEQ